MKLFREKKIINFDEKKVEVYELSVKELFKIANGEYKDDSDMLVDCTNLTKDEVESLTIEAFNAIYKEFLELNKEHLESKDGEKLDKKKLKK